MVPLADLRLILQFGIHRRVHFSAKLALRIFQSIHHVVEGHIADDQKIDVAAPAQLVTGGRTENECTPYAGGERRERLTNDPHGPGGFHEQRLQFRKDGGIAVHLEIHLPAFRRALQYPGLRECVQLALRGALGCAGFPQDLADVERLVRMAEEPRQQPAACAAKQYVCGLGRRLRTHIGYVCNQFGYACQPSGFTTSSSFPRSSMTLTATCRCSPASNGALTAPAR